MRGLSVPYIEGKFSLRASVTGEVVLDDVFVLEEHLLSGMGGLRGRFSCLNNTHEGTHYTHALILGRAQTGIAAFAG